MISRNKDEQMQHRTWSTSSLPIGHQNKNFGAAFKLTCLQEQSEILSLGLFHLESS
jgi:hypothetical protein